MTDHLIRLVSQWQQTEQLNDAQMATRLAVHPSTWSQLKSGNRTPGVEFIGHVIVALPQYIPQVLVYLKERASGKESITQKGDR